MDSQGKERIQQPQHVLSQWMNASSGGGEVTAIDLCVFKTIGNMTETNSFLHIEPLSSPYSNACFQVQSEAAFMRKIVQALPPIGVGEILCT